MFGIKLMHGSNFDVISHEVLIMQQKGFLDEINELASNVTEFLGKVDSDWLEYKVKNGTCIGYGLFKVDGVIAAQYNEMSDGAMLDFHTHDGKEIGMTFEGKYEFIFKNGKKKLIGPGELIHFQAGVAHGAKAIGDVKALWIIYRDTAGYPNARGF